MNKPKTEKIGMKTKNLLLIGSAALIPTPAAILADFGLFYIFIRVFAAMTENRDRSLFVVEAVLWILCGVLFPGIEWITWRIFRRTGMLGKKELHIALLAGAVVYAIAMALLFPASLDILFVYLPKSELGPGLSLLFFQLAAYAAAAVCGIVHAIGVWTGTKEK